MQKPKQIPTILVIESSPQHLRLIQAILEQEGWQTIGFQRAEEALKFLQERPLSLPDVIAIDADLHRPGIDGLEFLEYLRKKDEWKWTTDEWRQIPVILITLLGYEKRVKEAAKKYNAIIIPKPFDNSDVIREVKRALRKKGGVG